MATTTYQEPTLWPLDKYARLAPDSKDTLPLSGAGSKKGGGSWIHFTSSKDAVVQLALLDSNHLMISQGSTIYESFSLWDAQKWIRGVSKGDSILFICQLKGETRRFRIKFSAQPPHKTPLQACNECILKLSSLITIMNASSFSQASQLSVDDNQMFSQQMFSQAQEPTVVATVVPPSADVTTMIQAKETFQPASSVENMNGNDCNLMPISDIAKAVSIGGKSLEKAYVGTNLPVSQLGDFIRLCLTDSNFPAFVGATEKELHNITK